MPPAAARPAVVDEAGMQIRTLRHDGTLHQDEHGTGHEGRAGPAQGRKQRASGAGSRRRSP
ncbi:hypothetical protein ACFVY9_23315 [Streptomyces sp. NPDC059544]|uniref:hypothetical protein n=1 Tax=Streptomyces sp. NPDC059544 TaxID=3346861 RepID=UPI003696151E